MPDITETFFAKDLPAWRRWLQRHHAAALEIWLVFLKKHVGAPCVTYDDALDEALCFGWVDGLKKRIDGDRYAYRFSPRRPRSAWSAINKRRVERLVVAGRMQASGLARVEAARESGEWKRRRTIPVPREVPAELAGALANDEMAARAFAALAPSHKRQWMTWIADGKRPETRERRAREAAQRLAVGRKTLMD